MQSKALDRKNLWKFGPFVVGISVGLLRSSPGRVASPPFQVPLGGKALEILTYTAQRTFEAGGASLEEIASTVWSGKVKPGVLRSYVTRIRGALGDDKTRTRVLAADAAPGLSRKLWILPKVARATSADLGAPFRNLPVHLRPAFPVGSPRAVHRRLAAILARCGRAAIIGESGLGKTVCALNFTEASLKLGSYRSVVWLVASDASLLRASVLAVAARLGILDPLRARWDPLESTCRHASLSIL